MSTRAVYTFSSHGESYSVYGHHDGYPTGAAQKLKATLDSGKIWPLPRFESDEFAAGFIAANKESGGSVRLTDGPESHGDLDWRYHVSMGANTLLITVSDGDGGFVWDGTLSQFIETQAERIESGE